MLLLKSQNLLYAGSSTSVDIKEHANPQQVLIIRASPSTREPFLGERFARCLALKISVRPPANLSQTRVKFSRGRRNARLGAPLMSASSKAKTMLTAVLSSETNQNYTVTPSCLKILLLIIPRKANPKTVLTLVTPKQEHILKSPFLE